MRIYAPQVSANILHSNLFNSSLIDANSPLFDPAYPLSNLDNRSPSVITRLTGNGSVSSPIYLELDFNAKQYVEAVAVLGTNVKSYGSVAVVGDPVNDTPIAWRKRMLTMPNLLQNGGAERGTISDGTEVGGDCDLSMINLWDDVLGNVGSTAGVVYQLPLDYPLLFAPYTGEIIPKPASYNEYTNRFCGRFRKITGGVTRAAAFLETSHTPAFSDTVNTENIFVARGRYRFPGTPGTPPTINLRATFQNYTNPVEVSVNAVTGDNLWHEFELRLNLGQGLSSFGRVILAFFISDGDEDLYFDFDDCIIYKETEPGYEEQYLENEETGSFIYFLAPDERVVRTLRFQFVNEFNGDGYIDIGRILVCRNLSVWAGDPLQESEALAQDVALTDSGIYYLQNGGLTVPNLQINFPFDRRGPIDELRNLITRQRSDDPVYISLYGETTPNRALYGSFIGNLQIRETGLPFIGSASVNLLNER